MTETKPKGSWKGYSFTTAISRNKDAIKLYIAAIGGINIMPPFDWGTLGVTVGIGFFALLTKIAADAIDFYSSEVEI